MRSIANLLILFFVLGLFIIPKQNLFAQENSHTCCTTEKTSNKDCCKEHSDKNKKPCEETSSCCVVNTCCTVALITPLSSALPKVTIDLSHVNHSYSYTTPHFSNYLEDIWQPPKTV